VSAAPDDGNPYARLLHLIGYAPIGHFLTPELISGTAEYASQLLSNACETVAN
jgi:hypothetical protein